MAFNEQSNPPFVLDDRDLAWHLRRWEVEAGLQPFSESHSWSRIWFAQGVEGLLPVLEKEPAGDLAPHQACLLAFLRQLQVPQALFNTTVARHKDLYYRRMLGLKERSGIADQVVVGIELVSGEAQRLVPVGTLLDGGQDAVQAPQYYQLEQNLLANAGRVGDLFWFRPRSSEAPGFRVKAFSEAEGIAWPEHGLRLFEAFSPSGNASVSPSEQTVLGGRVIASAALALGPGERTLALTFKTAPDHPERMLAWVTAGGEWVGVGVAWADGVLTLSLDADAPAIEAAPGLDNWPYTVPLLKLIHQDGTEVPAVTALKLTVDAAGGVLMATDTGVVDGNEQFHPFGPEPKRGNALYLASPDWVKPAGQLRVTLVPEWLGLPPESFAKWYAEYTSIGAGPLVPLMNNDSFKLDASVSLFRLEAAPTTQNLFGGANDRPPTARNLTLTFDALTRAPSDSGDPRDGQCLRLELAGQDFRHEEYWHHLVSAGIDTDPWKPPRTALLKRLQVNYEYTYELDEARDAQLLLTPFGYSSESANDDACQIFVGLWDVRPGEQLSLYWRLRNPGGFAVNWSYLCRDNRWCALDADIEDATSGLSRSGLWRARLPLDAADHAPAMPQGRYWLRGTWTDRDPNAAREGPRDNGENTPLPVQTPWLYGVLSNAATAVRVSGDKPVLAAGTISHAVENLEGVQGFNQPWPSEGGRPSENAEAFMARVALRINHRQRVVSRGDIAALLLERFPAIFDVRLAEVGPDTRFEREPALQVVVIPRLEDSDTTDPLRPMFNQARLQEMRAYVYHRASPWLTIDLANPLYRSVTVTYILTFRDGLSPEFGYQQVHDALVAHYMPWGELTSNVSVALGADLDYFELLSVIQALPWVAQVQNLNIAGGQASIIAEPLEVLILRLNPPDPPGPTIYPTAVPEGREPGHRSRR